MSESVRVPPPTSLIGAVLGRYRLERLLGEGGMGVVYAARHQDLGKLAAVKLLHDRHDASEQVRVRFLREGQAISRIRHPNIVDVYDVGTDDERVYLVMELLEGEDLRSLLARESPLSPQRAADLLVPVIAAVAAAHDLGVVHRDLKPDNVFLSSERGSVSPKVLDFGISKVVDPEKASSLTGTGTLLGTPYYMSPEQAQTDKNVDARSDQYSLGVILYECITGRRPVEEAALYALIHRIVQGDFPAPRQIVPGIGALFEHVVLRAMARKPDDRFPNTRALGLALLPFASERIRANYAEELAHQEPGHVITPVGGAPNAASGLHTTLGESVHERDSERQPATPRSYLLPASLAVLAVGTALSAVWKLSASAPVVPSAEPIQHGSAAQPTPSALPSSAPPPSGPSEVASATGAAPAGSAPEVAVAASATLPATAPASAPKPPIPRRTPRSDRPELAPR